jgi:dTDP-glucose 4,6-dehydratase
MSKRVLLTGASGFIGSNVLDYMLENTNWEFVCTCSWSHMGTPLNLQRYVQTQRVKIITHDLTAQMPNLGSFDFILNLASESHVDRSIADPYNFIMNNVQLTMRLLEYARQYPPEVFLQFSTDEVYGANDHLEYDVYDATNPYSASKAMQEQAARAYHDTFGINVVITNSNNIIGRNQAVEKFVPKIIELITNNDTVKIHTANGKPGSRHWNPVQNVADALMFILAQPYPAGKTPHYSLPGGKNLDNLEMALLIAKILGKPLKYELQDATLDRPFYDEQYPHTDGKLTQLGWVPPFTLEEGLSWIKPM